MEKSLQKLRKIVFVLQVLGRAMFHFENAYHIPNSYVLGYSCKTNLPSNTAFRGFGGPQGMFAGEHIVRDVAYALGKDVMEISTNTFCDACKFNLPN